MGISTDAILAYGIQLDLVEEPFPGEPEEESDEFESDHEAPWWLRYWGKTTGAIQIVTHCHCDYPEFIVAAAGTVTEAYRGTPRRIASFEAPEHADAEIMAYCEKYELPTKGEPGWFLCSYWDG